MLEVRRCPKKTLRSLFKLPYGKTTTVSVSFPPPTCPAFALAAALRRRRPRRRRRPPPGRAPGRRARRQLRRDPQGAGIPEPSMSAARAPRPPEPGGAAALGGRPPSEPSAASTRAPPRISDVKKSRREVFCNFRPLEAFSGPPERQKRIQDEKPVLGNGSGLPGIAY